LRGLVGLGGFCGDERDEYGDMRPECLFVSIPHWEKEMSWIRGLDLPRQSFLGRCPLFVVSYREI